MATAPARGKSATDKKIQREIIAISDDVRQKHGWLKHQNTIGLSIFSIAVIGTVVNAVLYLQGIMPGWAVILLTAFWTSLLHELEHDLIHLMYFKKNKFMHNLMMTGIYLLRPNVINPWIRRHLHFHHHKHSGMETDLEERGITNGEKWGLKRLLMVGDGMLAVYLRAGQYLTEPARLFKRGLISKQDVKNVRLIGLVSYSPLGIAAHAIWHFFVLYHLANGVAWLAGTSIAWPEMVTAQLSWITPLVVVLIAPNMLRTFCLHFISSNMHYYGDNEPGKITEQCQVLNVWWLWPLQAFCFNFGSTHAIHHFVVRDPFYVRQMTAKRAHVVLKENGVRFNDLGTFRRANRMHEKPQAA
ncbi:MAG: fatty acid desaturase [Alcanivorax sp.]|uniref:fatty acid desaturase n=1 Tax=Alcanivorax sp. TaxID=1872427 RepID=UPI003DA6EF81